jgi:hypothetical protein
LPTLSHCFSNEQNSQGIQVEVFGEKMKEKSKRILVELKRFTTIPMEVTQHDLPITKFTAIDRSAVLFYSTWDDYQKSDNHTVLWPKNEKNLHNSAKDLYFLVYVVDRIPSSYEYKEKFVAFLGRSKLFLDYFLEVNEASISLKTYRMFQQPNCREVKQVFVNQFSMATHKWENQKFWIEKFDNLNQCELVIDAIHPQNLALQIDFNNENTTTYRGYVTKLNDIISKKLNFSFVFNPTKKIDDYLNLEQLVIYEKFNKSLKYSDLQYEISSFRKSKIEGSFALLSTTWSSRITTVDEVILVARFKPYTALEKVFLPFQDEVWYWLIGTLGFIVSISVVILIFASKKVQRFTFGSRVKTVMLNLM